MLTNIKIVSSTFDSTSSSTSDQLPNQAGFTETLTIDLSGVGDDNQVEYNQSDENETSSSTSTNAPIDLEMIACKLRSVDSSNNTSPWSPVLTVKLTREVKFAPGLKHFFHTSGSNDLISNLTRDSTFESALKSVEAKESLYSRFFIIFLGN